jgi:hypothetical protein
MFSKVYRGASNIVQCYMCKVLYSIPSKRGKTVHRKAKSFARALPVTIDSGLPALYSTNRIQNNFLDLKFYTIVSFYLPFLLISVQRNTQ